MSAARHGSEGRRRVLVQVLLLDILAVSGLGVAGWTWAPPAP